MSGMVPPNLGILPSDRLELGRKQKSKKVSKLKIFLRFFNFVHFEKNGTKLVCERMKTNIFVATSNPTDLLRGQEPDRRNSSTTACPCMPAPDLQDNFYALPN